MKKISDDWTPECRDMFRLARSLSQELGHHEIITLEHVYLALLHIVHGYDLEEIKATAREIMPPWEGACILSPGGKTPSMWRALDHAAKVASAQFRRITTRDIWNSLPHGNPESTAFLDKRFSIDAKIET